MQLILIIEDGGYQFPHITQQKKVLLGTRKIHVFAFKLYQ